MQSVIQEQPQLLLKNKTAVACLDRIGLVVAIVDDGDVVDR